MTGRKCKNLIAHPNPEVPQAHKLLTSQTSNQDCKTAGISLGIRVLKNLQALELIALQQRDPHQPILAAHDA
jgi:hypothetical protein